MYLAVFIGIIPFLFGTFYDFSVFIVSAIFSVILLIKFIKNKKIRVSINDALLLSIILLIFSLLTIFWAIDQNNAIGGTLRYLSLIIFSILLMQISKEEREKILNIIPYSGLIMLVISIAMGFIPEIRNIVYSESNRITGFFQYSNTFALYLLIGFIIATNKKNNKYLILISIILLLGIFMTGSRTTFLIVTLYIIYISFRKENKFRKWYGIGYLGIILVIGIYVLITKNLENIGRIFSISLNSSTLWGRLLYWKDGINLLIQNIFGYGYMGYSYKIYELQTGMYQTKFIHNDYLQMALDIGIIPLIVFIIFLIKSIFSKKNTTLNKSILITIMLHMFLEFDLQFMIIFYILIMCFENKNYKEFELTPSITLYIAILISTFIFGYCGVAYFMNYIGKNDVAINMLNNYTEAKIELMMNTENLEMAHKYADEILQKNKYVYQSYRINTTYYLQDGDYEKMIDNKKKEISLDKYNPKVYEEYIYMLSQVMQFYAENQNEAKILEYAKYILEVENMINDVKSNTSLITEKLQDSSEIELNEATQNYIQEIKRIVEH